MKGSANGTAEIHAKQAVQAAHQHLSLAKTKSDLNQHLSLAKPSSDSPQVSKPEIRKIGAIRPKPVEVQAQAVSEAEAETLPTASVVAVVTTPQAGSHLMSDSLLPVAAARPLDVTAARPAARAVRIAEHVGQPQESGGLATLFRHWFKAF